MNATGPDEHAVLGQAAEWFAVLRDDRASDTDRDRWRAWLAANPAHRRAWQRVEAISQPFDQLGRVTASSEAARSAITAARRQSRRRALGGLLGLTGVAVGAGVLGRALLPWQAWWYQAATHTASLRTAVGEVRTLTLEDGSELTLSTATAVDLAFNAAERRILLRSGEIFISSAKDPVSPQRDLMVDTGHGRVTALGTRFSVSSDTRQASVAVFDGAVRVQPARGASRELAAGQQTDFDAHGSQPPSHAEAAREAWSRGLLVADDVPLGRFIADLARYTPMRIDVAPDVAELRLVGVYRFDQPARNVPQILMALEQALPVRVRQSDGATLRIAAR